MRHRTGILRELCGAQEADIVDALDRARAHVGREFRIAEHGEAFLETELEPVAAGHTVARPVVEILMRHHRFDALKTRIGGGGRIGKHARGVEDVQALVLHGAHVEVVHRHDHEDVQIVFTAIDLLVPGHGVLEREHRVVALVHILVLDKDAQRDVAAGTRGEAVFHTGQIAGHQSEQIAGFAERIFPAYPVPAVLFPALGHGIAIGQQDGIAGLVGDHAGGKRRHHIGAVQVVGNLAKPFSLALRAEHLLRLVQAFQAGVFLGLDHSHAFQNEAGAIDIHGCGQRQDCQRFLGDAVLVRRQQAAVNAQ